MPVAPKGRGAEGVGMVCSEVADLRDVGVVVPFFSLPIELVLSTDPRLACGGAKETFALVDFSRTRTGAGLGMGLSLVVVVVRSFVFPEVYRRR